jgi:AbrB family looped-hinge helix DNA binding protein
MASKVTTKGQVTIPKAVRDRLGVRPGDQVKFHLEPDCRVVITKSDGSKPKSRFDAIRGAAGPGPTTDEVMALLRGWD